MKSIPLISGRAMAASLLFGTSAISQALSAADFGVNKARAKAEYKADKKVGASLASNAKDNGLATAKANFGKL